MSTDRPRPRLGDHLRVAALLLRTLAGVVPFALGILAAPVAAPRARARLARALAAPPTAPSDPPPIDPATWVGRRVFVVAGEPSGDRLAARVVRAVRAAAPGVVVEGYGGPALAAAGAHLHEDVVEHAVVGVVAVVRSLGTWWGLCARTLARWRAAPPDVLLTVDFPGLNLRLARWARARGVPTVHLVAPQTWAWAPWRTRRVRRAVDRLLVTFPFEAPWFEAAGVPARFVGHPLFEDAPPPAPPACGDAPLVELRPGSRRREASRQGPIVLEAAAALEASRPGARFVVRLPGPRARRAFEEARSRARATPSRLDVVEGPPERDAPAPCAALTTSGTSTCELAVAGVPMAVLYRLSPLARLGARVLVTSPFVAMPNLLAGRAVVPERLVGRGGGRALADDLLPLLSPGPARAAAVAGLATVRARLVHAGVAERVARETLDAVPRAAR